MRSLTILVLALNEEENIEQTVLELLQVGREHLDKFEIITINDGSTDNTGRIMDALAGDNSEVRVIHHLKPGSWAGGFRESIDQARFDYLTGLPGDRAYNAKGLIPLLRAVGEAPFIIGYRTNQFQSRLFGRAVLSRLYSLLGSVLARKNIKDIHGPYVMPVDVLRKLDLKLYGPGSNMELLVKLLRNHQRFIEVPVTLNAYVAGSSRSLRFKSLVDVIKTIGVLVRYKSQ